MTRPGRREPLDTLGELLHAATTADLQRSTAPTRTKETPVSARFTPATVENVASAPSRGRSRRRAVAAVVAGLVLIPGAAVGANALISGDQVAESMPQGTLALLGTDPSCTAVRSGVEFDCTLRTAPVGDLDPGQWLGTVEPTVGADQRVNGGCRSRNAAGTRWRCFVGEEAVRQGTIGRDFLGQPSTGPGVG